MTLVDFEYFSSFSSRNFMTQLSYLHM